MIVPALNYHAAIVQLSCSQSIILSISLIIWYLYSIEPKWSLANIRDYCVKKAGILPNYNRKQCIKPPRTRQINSSTSLFRFHQDPDLHIFHTRISRVPLPGPEETFQIVFCKRVACIHEKTSLFIYFVSASEYICNLIEYWYIISYWFLPMMVMIDKTRIEFPLWFLVRLPYFFVRKRIWQEVCRNKILPISK